MNADDEVNAAISEFREHIGNRHLTLDQKRRALKGLCHVSFQRLDELSPMVDLRLRAVMHEWHYIRKPYEPDFPVHQMGLGLVDVGIFVKRGEVG